MSKFSDTLVYLRKRAGFSQQELADKMEVSRSLVGMYESGQRMPSYEMLEALADIFNVNIDFLTGHEDSGEMSKEFREKLAHIIETRAHYQRGRPAFFGHGLPACGAARRKS